MYCMEKFHIKLPRGRYTKPHDVLQLRNLGVMFSHDKKVSTVEQTPILHIDSLYELLTLVREHGKISIDYNEYDQLILTMENYR